MHAPVAISVIVLRSRLFTVCSSHVEGPPKDVILILHENYSSYRSCLPPIHKVLVEMIALWAVYPSIP